MNAMAMRSFNLAAMLLVTICISGCGGTKLLDEPEPFSIEQPLATAEDERIAVYLDWVIVRDGPGTWARNADWDEYLLRVTNAGAKTVEVVSVTVVDSLGTRHTSLGDRKDLVRESKRTQRRYRGQGVKVKAGFGGGALLAIGGVSATVGMGAGAAAIYGSGAAVGATAGALVLAPVLVVGGVMRGVNNTKVNAEIERRHSPLAQTIEPQQVAVLDLFFPLAPSPQRVEVRYVDITGEHVLIVDTSSRLEGLHLPPAKGAVKDQGTVTFY